MCLAIPMRIKEIIDQDLCLVESDGTETKASLTLIDAPSVGDYVIVHAGYAIEKIDKQEADKTIRLFNELAELNIPKGIDFWQNYFED